MEDVCKLIPDSLSDVDLENTRWHRGCYQHFTMNLNCFQSESQAMLEDAQPSTSCPAPPPTKKKKKKHPEEGNKFVFPHGICLFCDKKTTTSGGKMFKPTERFTSWSQKKNLDGPILNR